MRTSKIKLIAVMLLSVILLLGFTACFGKEKKAADTFVGEYKSTFVDSQVAGDGLEYLLRINDDNSFTLTCKKNSEEHFKYTGTWKSYTESGKSQLLCTVESGFQWNKNNPDAWNPYFYLSRMDDGTVMASAGTTSSMNSVVTAFGSGDITLVTLILFEEK